MYVILQDRCWDVHIPFVRTFSLDFLHWITVIIIIVISCWHDVVFWSSTRPKMPFQSDAPEGSDTFQWPVYRKKSRRRIWLTKWDKVKAHDTLIDWCTGREWPLNCMTVISAWWLSNIPFQRLSKRLNYYITWWGQEVSELGTREVGDKM